MSTIRATNLQELTTGSTASIASIIASINAISNLATNSGATLVGYSGRTVDARLKDQPSLKDYGATGSNTTDVGPMLQAWHDALPNTGGTLYIPGGTFYVNTAVTFTKPVHLVGSGKGYIGATTFTTTNASTTLITHGSESTFQRFKFTSEVSRTAPFFKGVNVSRVGFEDFFSDKYYIFADEDGGSEVKFLNGELFDGVAGSVASGSCGIRLGYTNYTGSVTLSALYLKCQDGTKQCSYGIQMRFVDVVNAVGNTIIQHGNDVQIDPQAGQTASLLFFEGNTIDTSVNGLVVAPNGTGRVIRSSFAKNWFGQMTTSGVLITGSGVSDGLIFTGNQVGNNTSCGFNIDGPQAANITIALNDIGGCGLAGVRAASSTITNLRVLNNNIGAVGKYANNTTGIAIASGVTGEVSGNRDAGNTTFISNGSVNIVGLWVAFAPTLTASTGSITASTPTGRYVRTSGKTIHVLYDVAVSNNGTGAAAAILTLPVASAGPVFLAGREAGTTSKMLQAFAGAAASSVSVLNYDGSYPVVNGARMILSGTYEAA